MFKLNRLGLLLLLSLMGGMVGILYGVYENYKLSGFDVKYVYQSDLIKNLVFYIRNDDYKKDYQEFLIREKNRDTTVTINFPLYYLASGEKIYLRKNKGNKDIVEFYDPTNSRAFDGFITGFIDTAYIHDSFPQNEK